MEIYHIDDAGRNVQVLRDLDEEAWRGIVAQMFLYWPNWTPGAELLEFYLQKLHQYPAVAVWRYIESYAKSGEDFPPIVGKILAYLEPRHGERIAAETRDGFRDEQGHLLPPDQLLPLILLDRQRRREAYMPQTFPGAE